MAKTDKTPALSYLMQKAQSGDQNAYRQLLESIQPQLRAYIGKRIPDMDKVEDVLQDILFAIHHSRHTYNAKQPFMPWAYGIAYYKVMDNLRRHYRYEKNKTEAAGEIDHQTFLETLTPVKSNKGVVHAKEDLELAFSYLNDKQEKIIRRAKIDGAKIKDICVEMDMSESAVKVTIHRAMKKMQKAMKEKIEQKVQSNGD